MDTTARVLTLLQLLHERRFWTGAELSAELDVTVRCVRRDVQRLRDLGYPVHGSGGVGGGYSLGAGADLPPLPLDEDEAVAVAVGLRSAATGAVGGLRDAALCALAKLEAVLPRGLRSRISAVEQASSTMPRRASIDAGVLMALAGACRDSLLTELDYTARDGVRSHRRLHPIRLVHSDIRWYLVAWDLDRRDWRTFRLDRMDPGSVRAAGRLPPRDPPEPDLVAYVRRQIGHRCYTHQVRVRLLADADAVRERFGAYGEVEEAGEGRCWFQTGGDDLDAMAPWLATLGYGFDRVEPAAMRDALRRMGERMIRVSEA